MQQLDERLKDEDTKVAGVGLDAHISNVDLPPDPRKQGKLFLYKFRIQQEKEKEMLSTIPR